MKIGILEPEAFSKKALEILQTCGEVNSCSGSIMDFVSDKEVLFIRLGHAIDKNLLSKAEQLRIICTPTTGLNHIDTDFCAKRGIKILSLKGKKNFLKTIRATPEHTLGLTLALLRNYNRAFLHSDNPVWNRDKHKGYELYDSKVGIIGLGRVGKLLASYLGIFGAHISYFDPNVYSYIKCKKEPDILSLIDNSDIIVLCSSYEAGMENLIGRTELSAMKNKYFINTSRAELVDETSMTKLALAGHFMGLAVDVIQNEQTNRNNLSELLKAADRYNVLITPHIGGATFTSMERTEIFIASELQNILKKKMI